MKSGLFLRTIQHVQKYGQNRRQMNIELVTAEEVARALGTSPMKVKSAILNGTMPIGAVLTEGGRDRVVIIRARWEAWTQAKDLGGGEKWGN